MESLKDGCNMIILSMICDNINHDKPLNSYNSPDDC